ncbi:hypothetical protein ACFC18_32945 [Streptomyces sp. NPDC056121]|uniref:hypothetical protein n=1 Tax=unclassified Streptomyces TaxID=2593676 RepID=UPI0035D7CF15
MIEQYTVATRRIPVRQQQLGLQLGSLSPLLLPLPLAPPTTPRLVRGRVEERQRWRRRRTGIEAIHHRDDEL